MIQMNKKGWLSFIGLLGLITIGVAMTCPQQPSTKEEGTLKVVMVTDSGSIDDKSFNQGTWEGIERFKADDEEVKINYLTPNDSSTEAFLTTIDNAVLSGADVVITPGFSFEEAIGKAQEQYPKVKFVLIDGQPLVDGEYQIKSNVQSISFKEQEASFLTGVASAMSSQTGKVGFLGGVKIPAVEKLGYGFVAGVAYANDVLNTNVDVVDYVYQGTFEDTQAGQMIASGMYDKGADVILQAAGLVGVGAINEAKLRTEAGESCYVVGVDVDQYEAGLMSDGSSVILTSAMKKLDEAVYQALADIQANNFNGGSSSTLGIEQAGVGLPHENPNLDESITTTIESVKHLVATGEIQVPAALEETKAFIEAHGMDSSFLTE